MVICHLCKKSFQVISNTHLAAVHAGTIQSYVQKFGLDGVGFIKSFTKIPKTDPRYKAWRKSLLRRPPPWSKGHTKETHPSIAKMALTFKKKQLNNFKQWQELQRNLGKFGSPTIPLKRDAKLAFLLGLILGDGHLDILERTESLRITLGTDKPLLWKLACKIIEDVFHKKPYVLRRKTACVDIGIYQRGLSERLGIPAGNRSLVVSSVPDWIQSDHNFLIAYIRGLFEAEG